MPSLERWCAAISCCDPAWEAAYRRFESPEEEVRKFRRRLIALGAQDWPRTSRVLELCCGRGNGLKALASLGFTSLSGVDLSDSLLQTYDGPGKLYVGDCRDLKLDDQTIDIVIVQGGLHHLPDLPGDLALTLREVHRVLRPGGSFVLVEPWDTPFLKIVHACCRFAPARQVWSKLDALATMINIERTTYESWLGRGDEIRRLLRTYFQIERETAAWGKLVFLGRISEPSAAGRD